MLVGVTGGKGGRGREGKAYVFAVCAFALRRGARGFSCGGLVRISWVDLEWIWVGGRGECLTRVFRLVRARWCGRGRTLGGGDCWGRGEERKWI